MNEPILRSLETKTRKVHARGGLHYIRGNSAPYFSLTMASWRKKRGWWDEDTFGAAHDELVKLWPELAPLAALHLSDIDGVPRHAAANAFYWAAGAMGGLGEKYHGGNSNPIKTPDECLDIFAKHVRVSLDEAREVVEMLQNEIDTKTTHYGRVYEGAAGPVAKAALALWCDAQKPRWKAEADKCIADLEMVVYGDKWP